MPISEDMREWAGRQVRDWSREQGITESDPSRSAYRLTHGYDEGKKGVTWADLFAAFLGDPKARGVEALVIGNWDGDMRGDDSSVVVEALVSAADRLPHLTALFVGDITYEENEISWIRQSDLAPLFNAFPGLEHFGARGGNNLSLGVPRLPRLKTLVIEAGGLPLRVVEEVLAAEMPRIERLELWLGDEGYGAEATLDDLAPFFGDLAPEKWPNLRHLGLRDSELSDGIAVSLANAPLMAQLETLDLSLGTLGDEGARALAASPFAARLKKLDIHHHFVSPDGVAKLIASGIGEVNADEPQEPDAWQGEEHRYVAVGE